jgi:hypothetical protein
MALEQIGFIPVSPVNAAKEWAGECWPQCIRLTKEGAACAWQAKQTWDVNEQHSFWTASSAVEWCEALGVQFKTVFMGELPNAYQS